MTISVETTSSANSYQSKLPSSSWTAPQCSRTRTTCLQGVMGERGTLE
jgi:hypothetical protein